MYVKTKYLLNEVYLSMEIAQERKSTHSCSNPYIYRYVHTVAAMHIFW